MGCESIPDVEPGDAIIDEDCLKMLEIPVLSFTVLVTRKLDDVESIVTWSLESLSLDTRLVSLSVGCELGTFELEFVKCHGVLVLFVEDEEKLVKCGLSLIHI